MNKLQERVESAVRHIAHGWNLKGDCESELIDAIRQVFEACATTASDLASPYATLDELEETCSAKQAPEAAKAFWLDKSKSVEEREKAFNKYGEHEEFIWLPDDPVIKPLFDKYYEHDDEWPPRFMTMKTLHVIEWWLDKLTLHREPEPREGAVERLRSIHREKLFKLGVSQFVYDW